MWLACFVLSAIIIRRVRNPIRIALAILLGGVVEDAIGARSLTARLLHIVCIRLVGRGERRGTVLVVGE